jgi:arabinofuranosyltransferase
MNPRAAAKGWWLLALVALALLAGGCLLQAAQGYAHDDLSGHAEGSDDAFISFRYARNLVAGHGLVFNPGERVEGYTNLLYVLLMAPAAWLASPDRLLPIAIALNLIFAATAVLQLFAFTRERQGGPQAGMAALALALCPSLWVAVASGLETPLVLALQVAIWVTVERAAEGREGRRHAVALAVLAVLSCLVRADGFIAPALASVYLAVRGRLRGALLMGGTTAATFAALAAWRLSYYGFPLPNTYYAKVAGSLPERIEAALPLLSRVIFTTGMLLPAVALMLGVLALARRVSREREPLSSALSFPVLFAPAWAGYWIYVGGDVFYERFLLILFPMGTYVLLDLLRTVRRPMAVAAVVIVVLLQLVQTENDPRFRYQPERYDRWVLLGRHLASHHPDATLAVDAAGKVPYFSGLPAIDMLGLTDAHIAHVEPPPGRELIIGHSKQDNAYVLGRRPGLIATWIETDLDMKWGLMRPVYEGAGYRLRYLLNTEQGALEPNLLDVSGWPDEEITSRISRGYGYGVLERRDN